jgi:branched-chain amino acid aminotransferase
MDNDGSPGGDPRPLLSRSIPIDSSAALYGKGVFTTIAIRDSQPLLWEKHYRRLSNDLKTIGLPRISEEKTYAQLVKHLLEDQVVDGRVRITIFDSGASPIWEAGAEVETALDIISAPPRPPASTSRVGRSLFSVNSRSAVAGVKSCNYLENLMAIGEAKKRGFDEAVRPNERGEITCGCMSNVFWLKDGDLYTPSLRTACLPGTTREYVLDNLDCREVEAAMEELDAADSIFLTSAGIGIAEVTEFESRKLEPSSHPILKLWPPAQTGKRATTDAKGF